MRVTSSVNFSYLQQTFWFVSIDSEESSATVQQCTFVLSLPVLKKYFASFAMLWDMKYVANQAKFKYIARDWQSRGLNLAIDRPKIPCFSWWQAKSCWRQAGRVSATVPVTGRLPGFPGQLCIYITQLGVSLGLSELKCEAVTDFILLWSCKTLSGWSKIGALLPLPTLPRLWTTRSLLRPWTKLAQPCSVTKHLSRLCALFQWERMARALSCMYLDVLALSNKIYIVIFCGIYWYITYPGPPFPHVITHFTKEPLEPVTNLKVL